MHLPHAVRLNALCVFLFAAVALSQVTAVPPYTVSVFATGVAGVYFNPDSITMLDGHIFIGFGNNAATNGSSGHSVIVEYDGSGNIITHYIVKGHNDGLRANLKTHTIWAMQNEDANPNLVIIDPTKHTQTLYHFGPTPHGGGYDDIAFIGNDALFSCSNPAHNPNSYPAIVRAEFVGHFINVVPVLMGTATAIDIPTDTPVTLNLQDPDSMSFDPLGDLVLDSQADGELIILHHVLQLDQSVYHLGLTLGGAATQIDDTVYATASHGVILASDEGGNTVYLVSKDIFAPGTAYSAAPTSVTSNDLDTGVLTNVVTGLVSTHGMAFIPEDSAQ